MNVCVAEENSFARPPDSWQLCHLDEDLPEVESCRSQPSFIHADLNANASGVLSAFRLQSSAGIGPAAAWNSEEDVCWHMSGPGRAVTKLGCSLQRSWCWRFSQPHDSGLHLLPSAACFGPDSKCHRWKSVFCGPQPANDSIPHYLLNCPLKTDIKTDRLTSRYKRFSIIRVYSHPTTSTSCDM